MNNIFTTQSLLAIIQERRSIFPASYNDIKIDDDIILKLIEAARWAPTHRKTQPWYFKIYSGNALQRLSDYSAKWYKDNTPEEKYSSMKYEKTKKKALQSSHVIAIIMERHEDLLPEWEEVAAVACAVQNMWLMAASHGLGAYWSSPNSALDGNEFFGLTKNQKCLGLFYLGNTDQTNMTSDRKTIEEISEWVKE